MEIHRCDVTGSRIFSDAVIYFTSSYVMERSDVNYLWYICGYAMRLTTGYEYILSKGMKGQAKMKFSYILVWLAFVMLALLQPSSTWAQSSMVSQPNDVVAGKVLETRYKGLTFVDNRQYTQSEPVTFELTSSFGAAGSTIVVSGCEWDKGERVEFFFSNPPEKIGQGDAVLASGCFRSTVEIPSIVAPGVYEIEARGASGTSLTKVFTVVERELQLVPTVGPPGSPVEASGCSWDANEEAMLVLDGEPSLQLDSFQTDDDGCFDVTVYLPTNLTAGIYTLRAQSSEGSASTVFTVTRPELSVTPNSGPSGSVVQAGGCGWFAGDSILVNWQAGTLQQIASSIVDSMGCFTVLVTIPNSQNEDYTIRARGEIAVGSKAEATFTVMDPALLLAPSIGKRGDEIIAYGCGWIGNERIQLSWAVGNSLGETNVRDDGCFELKFFVPIDAVVEEQTLTALSTEGVSATSIFSIANAASFKLGPPLVDVDNTVVASGSGYGSGEVVSIQWRARQLQSVLSEEGGTWSTQFRVPTDAPAGEFMMSATGDLNSSAVATTTVDAEALLSISPAEVFQGREIRLCLDDWTDGERVTINIQDYESTGYHQVVDFKSNPGGSCETQIAAISPVLGTGTYTYIASGNQGHYASRTLSVVPDTTQPSVVATYSPQQPKEEQAVTVTAEATDNNNLTSITIAVRSTDAALSFTQETICSSNTTPDWQVGEQQWRCVTAPFTVPPGNYTYTITAKDIDGNQVSTTNRIRVLPKPPPKVDLRVGHMEITQGIQNENNDMALIAGKPTTVRVFLEAWQQEAQVSQTGIEAVLHGTRNGKTLPDSPLRSYETWGSADASGWTRDKSYNALNFDLPSSWLSGEYIQLRVELNPNNTIDEDITSNNSDDLQVRFWDTRPICVVMSPVRTTRGTVAGNFPSTPYGRYIIDRAETLLPTPRIKAFYQSAPIEEWEVFGFGPYEFEDDPDKILSAIWARGQFTDDPDWCDDRGARTHYVGVIHPNESSGNGKAGRGRDDLWFVARREGLPNQVQINVNGPYGGRTLAHELGHNYGRKHIDCGGPKDPDTAYPIDPCRFSSSDKGRTYTAFDRMTRAAFGPTRSLGGYNPPGDLMSYSDIRWTSPYTWRAIFMQLKYCPGGLCTFPARPPMVAANVGEPGTSDVQDESDVLLLYGSVNPDTREATLDLLYQVAPREMPAKKRETLLAANAPRGGEPIYTIQLLDAQGEVLIARPFSQSEAEEEAQSYHFFGLAIPHDERTAQLRITRDGDVLFTRDVSDSAPSVKILSPAEGEQVGEEMTVAWEASDLDDDNLRYMVQYSADAGATWTALSSEIFTPTLTVLTDWLAGSDGQSQVRVLASDGFHTTSATSANFSLANHAPVVVIDQPFSTTVPAGTTLLLRGEAFDNEDGVLEGSALVWSAKERDAALGQSASGGELLLQQIQPGTYDIDLQAIDSSETLGRATLTIVVEGEVDQPQTGNLFLPLVRK